MTQVTLTIDSQSVTVSEGSTILDACGLRTIRSRRCAISRI